MRDGLKKEPGLWNSTVGQSGVRNSQRSLPSLSSLLPSSSSSTLPVHPKCQHLHNWHESHHRVHRKQGIHPLSAHVSVNKNTSLPAAASPLRPNRNSKTNDGPDKAMEVDSHARRRRVRLHLIQAAWWASTVGEKTPVWKPLWNNRPQARFDACIRARRSRATRRTVSLADTAYADSSQSGAE